MKKIDIAKALQQLNNARRSGLIKNPEQPCVRRKAHVCANPPDEARQAILCSLLTSSLEAARGKVRLLLALDMLDEQRFAALCGFLRRQFEAGQPLSWGSRTVMRLIEWLAALKHIEVASFLLTCPLLSAACVGSDTGDHVHFWHRLKKAESKAVDASILADELANKQQQKLNDPDYNRVRRGTFRVSAECRLRGVSAKRIGHT